MPVDAPHGILLPTFPVLVLLLALAGCGTTSGPNGADAASQGPDPGASSSTDGVGESSPPCKLDWRAAVAAGRSRLESDDLEGARESLLCASLLHPSLESLRGALENVEGRLYRKLLAESQELLKRGRSLLAVEVLAHAAALPHDAGEGRAAGRRLEQMGYRFYASRWVHRDDIKSLERRESRIAAGRRQELELGEEFTLDRRGGVRIFTDLPRVEAMMHARRLHVLVEALRRTYSDLLYPVGLPPHGEPPDGLDIVVFAERADYRELTGSESTVGMFLPQYRASFFFLGEQSFDENVTVLLHEGCHLLDDRLLGIERPPNWLREGLAVYVEGAALSPGGELRLPDGLPASRLARLRDALRAGGDRWWGVRRLVGRETLQDLHGLDSVHDYYDQAGLLVAVLLEDRLLPREMFYRLVGKARVPDSGPETAWDDFRSVIRGYGETAESIDATLKEAVNTTIP